MLILPASLSLSLSLARPLGLHASQRKPPHFRPTVVLHPETQGCDHSFCLHLPLPNRRSQKKNQHRTLSAYRFLWPFFTLPLTLPRLISRLAQSCPVQLPVCAISYASICTDGVFLPSSRIAPPDQLPKDRHDLDQEKHVTQNTKHRTQVVPHGNPPIFFHFEHPTPFRSPSCPAPSGCVVAGAPDAAWRRP